MEINNFEQFSMVVKTLSEPKFHNHCFIEVDFSRQDIRDLTFTDCSFVKCNFTNCKLDNIIISNCNLKGCNFSASDLPFSKISDSFFIDCLFNSAYAYKSEWKSSNFRRCSFRNIYLKESTLDHINIFYSNLVNAKLADSNIKNIQYNYATAFFALQCPEEGSFIGWKKAGDEDKYLVKLLITEDSKRSSATTRKCRCSKAKVLSIEPIHDSPEVEEIESEYDPEFIYKVGEYVEVNDFDENRWKECTTGIHFFLTKQEALDYN